MGCQGGKPSYDKADEEYSFSVAASAVVTDEEDFESATRATLEEGTYNYYWENGDMIGLFATNNDYALRLTNIKMINNNHAAEQRFTSFDGKLTTAQYQSMPTGTYYYAAYYPYQQNATLDASTFSLSGLSLPSVQNVTSIGADGFRSDCDFMLTQPVSAGTVAAVEPADIQFSGSKGFRHLFSAVRMHVSDDEMGGQKIRSLTLTAPEGVALTGDFEVNLWTRAVNFTNPSNSVTVNIPSGMGDLESGNNCVWAIINPVDLSTERMVLTVTTESGYQYTYTFDGDTYRAGSFHDLDFKIPQMKVDVNRIYTSYNDRNNSIDGNSIFFDGVAISGAVPDADGYGYSVDIAETGVMCNGSSVYSTTDKATSFSHTHTIGNYSELGEYNAQAYVKLANGSVLTSSEPNVHVTGIPYNREVTSDGGGIMFGSDTGVGAFNDSNFPWTEGNGATDRGNYIELSLSGKNYVTSFPFHIPATIPVKAHGWFSYSNRASTGTLYAGAVSSVSYNTNVSIKVTNISVTGGAYYTFPNFNLTPANNRISLYENNGLAMYYLHKVSVLYAN